AELRRGRQADELQRGRGQDAVPPSAEGVEGSRPEGRRVNENDEDLELAALQRRLDDAFETTRPRPGFDDELWLRMQSSRPASSRLRDAPPGLIRGIRPVPTVPLAAAASFLVIALLLGLLPRFGVGGGNTATASFGWPAATA